MTGRLPTAIRWKSSKMTIVKWLSPRCGDSWVSPTTDDLFGNQFLIFFAIAKNMRYGSQTMDLS